MSWRPAPSRLIRPAAGTLSVAALLLLSGCLRGCPSSRPPIHLNPNMDQQPRYEPQAESHFFYDGKTMRAPVPDTIARGDLVEDELFESGRSVWGDYATRIPLKIDARLLERGRERFHIYCTPCHGEKGDGMGMLRARAGVTAANLLEERIRRMPVGRLFEVITNGKGLMPGYRFPIPVRDRWAIVAHVGRLQEAGHAN